MKLSKFILASTTIFLSPSFSFAQNPDILFEIAGSATSSPPAESNPIYIAPDDAFSSWYKVFKPV